MEHLLLAPATRSHLKSLSVDQPHALLLVGPIGIGKRTVALAWADLVAEPASITIIEPEEKGSITIETVRGLYRRTRSRHTSRQVVIVDNAQGMSIDAQNAFLKLLEEPNANISFVLTAPTSQALLATITSRVQTVVLPRLPTGLLQPFVAAQGSTLSAQDQAQLLYVADGRPAVLASLLKDPAAFESYRQTMTKAKQLLAADSYQQLSQVGELIKDKQQLLDTLDALGHMLHTQIMARPEPRLLSFAHKLEQCQLRLAQNGNPRAQLTALFTRS